MLNTLSSPTRRVGLTLLVSLVTACVPSLGPSVTPAADRAVEIYNDTFEDAYVVAMPCGNISCPIPIVTVTARSHQLVRVPRRFLQPVNQLTLGYKTAPGREVQLIGTVILDAEQQAVLTVGQVSTLRVR